jgi:hypothetical protein
VARTFVRCLEEDDLSEGTYQEKMTNDQPHEMG